MVAELRTIVRCGSIRDADGFRCLVLMRNAGERESGTLRRAAPMALPMTVTVRIHRFCAGSLFKMLLTGDQVRSRPVTYIDRRDDGQAGP